MGERAKQISNGRSLGWISSKFDGVTRQHLVGAGAASVVVLAGVAAVYVWKRRRDGQGCESNASRMRSGTSRRAQILGALRSGRLAVKRILDTRHPSEAVAAKAEENLKMLLNKEDILLNVVKLQNTVAKLEMTRKERVGLELLMKAHERATKKGHSHEAYELDMLIVEMLIYQGNYEAALRRKCLEEEDISDARRPLYKTIIQLILGREEAKDSWQKYQDLRGRWRLQESVPDASDYPLAQDFGKFKKAVKFLKEEIKNAPEKKESEAVAKKIITIN